MSIVILVSVLAYLAGAGTTWRYLGYKFDTAMFNGRWHSFQSICGACNCKNCGDNVKYHARNDSRAWYSLGCTNYERRHMHLTALAGSFFLSLFAWAPIVAVYLFRTALAKTGIVDEIDFKFFTPAPTIETPAQKRERLAEERERRIAELEAENDELSKMFDMQIEAHRLTPNQYIEQLRTKSHPHRP